MRTTERTILHSLERWSKRTVVLITTFILFSCDSGTVFEQYRPIENGIWGIDEEYYFTCRITDARQAYDISLNIRNNNLYPYQNLWVFWQEEQPGNILVRDTLECMLADDFGKWYGKGVSLFESSFPLRTAYHFPDTGSYTFSFRQGMRTEQLKGIQEIGVKIILREE